MTSSTSTEKESRDSDVDVAGIEAYNLRAKIIAEFLRSHLDVRCSLAKLPGGGWHILMASTRRLGREETKIGDEIDELVGMLPRLYGLVEVNSNKRAAGYKAKIDAHQSDPWADFE